MKKNRYARSKELLDRASKVLASGVSSEFRKYNYPHALFYDCAKGSMVRDIDGNEYIDFTLSQGPLILGHSNQKVLDAVEAYSRTGQLFAGQHLKEIELAEKLQEIIPTAELMRFCLDGSEAVQTTIRVARSKTKKNLFLRFEGHYHGWLDNVAYGISTPAGGFGSRENPNVTAWSQGLADSSSAEFIVIPWNDVELLEKTIAKYHDVLAAVITEPIMCNNGCILPRKGYLEKMQKLCDQYRIALIFDEVITGFRVSLSGAQGYFNIQPDLSVFAKAMGSGYPISAVVGKKEWMDEITSGRVIHAGTMNANNPTVAASLATIEELQADSEVYDRLFRLGNQLKSGLEELAKKYRQNLLVQGPGPMINTSFTDLQAQHEYRDLQYSDVAKLNQFIRGLHDEGIRVIGRGLWYISAATREQDVGKALAAADKVFKNL